MSILWYLIRHPNNFSFEAMVGFGFIGMLEMFMEFAFLFKVCGFI